MIFNKLKNLSLAKFIVISGISLRLMQIFKETYYLRVFENSKDLSLYISLKANMDLFLILTSSVFFYESCYKNGKIHVPIFPIIISLFLGLYIVNNNLILSDNILLFLLVLFGSIVSVLGNMTVVLSKESKNLLYNFFANGFENYILLLIISIFVYFTLPESFILYTTIAFLAQLVVSLIIFYKLKKIPLTVQFNYSIKESFNSIPKIIGSAIILISMIITRTLFEINTNIILLNYSLIISATPLLLIERYFEYSKNNGLITDRPRYLYLIILLALIFAITLSIFLYFTNLIYDSTMNKIILIILNSLNFFLMLFPLFVYFILFKKTSNFNKNSIFLIITSYVICCFFSFDIQSVIFLLSTSIISSFLIIKNYEAKYL
jgi:hypothetical protein